MKEIHEVSTMDDMKNILKEVDLEIIHRRLDARKKTITADGKISKQQLTNAYRGFYGLSSQYQALLQKSDETKMHHQMQNEHHFKHNADMKTFSQLENTAKNHSEKEVTTLRNNFSAKLAYHYVYKNHTFKRYDVSKSAKPRKLRPFSDKPENYEMESRELGKQTSIHPLGSLRQIDIYKDELKLKFPPINDPVDTNEIKHHNVNMMGDKTYVDIDMDMESKVIERERVHITSFPNIENAMKIEIKYKYKPLSDDKASLISAPAGILNGDGETYSDSNVILRKGHNLELMRENEMERYKKRRKLPTVPSVQNNAVVDEKKETFRRVLPESPKRSSTVYPCRVQNYSDFKKMLENAAAGVIDSWGNDILNTEISAMSKKARKANLKENLTSTSEGSRPTSAIFREFREYKKLPDERKVARYQNETDHAIIIRQMSPVPRVESPIAQRRNEYIRASTPYQKREGSPVSTKVGKLHRTAIEIFPSVSRTSSYRDVFEQPADLQERSMLTAAERIELEKRTRERKSNEETEIIKELEDEDIVNKNVHLKPGRQLPQLPTVDKVLDQVKTVHEQLETKEHVTNFTNGIHIQHVEKEIAMINEIKPANNKNATNTAGSVSATSRHITASQTYMSQAKQVDSSATGDIPFPAETLSRMKDASDMYGRDLWPKLSKKMQFNYESFTRTTPEKKKILEIRAKNKRKVHLKNAQIAEESKRTQKSTADLERPTTRVSFNENVTVFEAV